MIINLKPTAEELEELRVITKRNLDHIWIYEPEDMLPYELPWSDEDIQTITTVLDVLHNGGRVLLLTPDSDIPQELTLEQEV